LEDFLSIIQISVEFFTIPEYPYFDILNGQTCFFTLKKSNQPVCKNMTLLGMSIKRSNILIYPLNILNTFPFPYKSSQFDKIISFKVAEIKTFSSRFVTKTNY